MPESSQFAQSVSELLESAVYARDLTTTMAAEASFRREEAKRQELERLSSPLTLARTEAALLGNHMLQVVADQYLIKRGSLLTRAKKKISRLPEHAQISRSHLDESIAESELILPTQTEYIPAEDPSLVPGYAEVVSGWKFSVAGLRVIKPEPSLCGIFIAKNLLVDYETCTEKVTSKILYEFSEPWRPVATESPQVDGVIIEDDETLIFHRALFRAARIALGDQTAEYYKFKPKILQEKRRSTTNILTRDNNDVLVY